MDMSGMATNDTAYTGAVCMSITVVGNTTNLPLSDPFCNTDACLAFKEAHTASQNAVSYAYQYAYGHFTTWYYLVVLGIATAIYGARLYRNWRPPQAGARPTTRTMSFMYKSAALIRTVQYRSIGGVRAARFGVPRLGVLAFLLVSWVVFVLMVFWQHPYYRDRRGYGSPPLGVRAGLMSTAMTPIVVALAGKVNIVAWLTGIGHEKLNVIHRWASYLTLFLAVVHTVPFIVIALDKCGPDGLRAQFYRPGVPPLGMLVGLCVLSVPWIRHRFYNLFYRIHIPMYVAYLGLMFWHANNELDSWSYLWATLAIWLFSNLVRLFTRWQTFNIKRSWFSGIPAVIRALPGDMTQVTLFVPGDLRWTPGQHCFLRMPHVSALQNHPYTIANLPSDEKSLSGVHEMTFYVRAQQGLTRDLFHSVIEHDERVLTMHLDGPYCGLVEDLPALYQSLIFAAGGSGISACLPHILHAAKSIRNGKGMVNYIRLVWMVRHPSHTKWLLDRLKDVRAILPAEAFQVDVYVTGQNLSTTSEDPNNKVETAATFSNNKVTSEVADKKPSVDATDMSTVLLGIGGMHNCRPYLPELVPEMITRRRVCVFGCGPESLTLDLGNGVAKAQIKVLRGECNTIALHTEKFGW